MQQSSAKKYAVPTVVVYDANTTVLQYHRALSKFCNQDEVKNAAL